MALRTTAPVPASRSMPTQDRNPPVPPLCPRDGLAIDLYRDPGRPDSDGADERGYGSSAAIPGALPSMRVWTGRAMSSIDARMPPAGAIASVSSHCRLWTTSAEATPWPGLSSDRADPPHCFATGCDPTWIQTHQRGLSELFSPLAELGGCPPRGGQHQGFGCGVAGYFSGMTTRPEAVKDMVDHVPSDPFAEDDVVHVPAAVAVLADAPMVHASIFITDVPDWDEPER